MNNKRSHLIVLALALALPLAFAGSAEAKGLSTSSAQRAIVKTVGKRTARHLDGSGVSPSTGTTLPDGIVFSVKRVYVAPGRCVRRSGYRVGCLFRVAGDLTSPDGSRAGGFVCSYGAFAFKTKHSHRIRTRSTRQVPGCVATG